MMTPVAHIVVNNNIMFRGCHSLEIEQDINNLATTGEVVLPLAAMYNNAKEKNKVIINDLVSQGDDISIYVGYKEDQLHHLFSGYITNINKDVRIKLSVEDAIYKLRQKPVVIDETDISVKQICQLLIEGIKGVAVHPDTPTIKVDEFKHNGNAAKALAQLKQSLTLTIYFDDQNRLYAGGQQLNPRGEIKAVYGQNIVKNKTAYQTKEANPILVEVIGKKDDGTEIKKVAGMEGGSKQTFYMYNVTSEEVLQQKAKEYLQKYSFDGFSGSIELFGIPFARAGGAVNYINRNYQDSEGVYFNEAVKTKLTKDNALRQTIKIGARLQ